MSEIGGREWRFYLNDMISFAHRVLSYTAGLDQHSFTANGIIYDATLRNSELIGEAATHIPDQVRSAHSEIPWRIIIATRNRLIHSYLGIDNDTIWSIIQDEIPALLPLLQALSDEQYVSGALAPSPWVKGITQAIAQEVEGQDREQNHETGCQSQPRRQKDVFLGIGKHVAPSRQGGLNAKTQKGKPGFSQNRRAHIQSGLDNDRRCRPR